MKLTLSFNFACFWSSDTSSHNLGVMWRGNQKKKSTGNFFSLDLPNGEACPGLVMILDFHLVSVPSSDMVITRGLLFTRMFVASTPRPVRQLNILWISPEIFAIPNDPGPGCSSPGTHPFNYVYFHGNHWLKTSSKIFSPQPWILHSIFHQKIFVKKWRW